MTTTSQEEHILQPLPLLASLPNFAIPALGMVLTYYVLMPDFTRLGKLPYTAYMIAFSIPLALLLVAALIGYGWRNGRLPPPPLPPDSATTASIATTGLGSSAASSWK